MEPWFTEFVAAVFGSANYIAGALAVITICIQMWVAVRLGRIQAFFFQRGRRSTLIRQLRGATSQLASLMKDFEGNQATIREALSKIRPNVEAVAHRFGGVEKSEAKSVLKSLDAYLGRRSGWMVWRVQHESDTEAGCRTVYERMLTLTEAVKIAGDDSNWSIPG